MAAPIRAVYYSADHSAHMSICQELCSTLVDRGHSVIVVAAEMNPRVECLQHISNVVLRPRSINTEPGRSTATIETEAAWLRTQKADVVISAAVSWGCAAAAAAGVCCVCIAYTTEGEACT